MAMARVLDAGHSVGLKPGTGLRPLMVNPIRSLSPLLAACRPRQWPKNLLVFAAPLFASAALDPSVVGTHRIGETVLVVDSVALMLGPIVQLLRKLGYRVLEATGALEVQRMIAVDKTVRLLVLDLSSVEISDLEFIAWFRMSHPAVKVVVAASSNWELNVYHGIAREITLLTKPFTPAELARLVRRVLA